MIRSRRVPETSRIFSPREPNSAWLFHGVRNFDRPTSDASKTAFNGNRVAFFSSIRTITHTYHSSLIERSTPFPQLYIAKRCIRTYIYIHASGYNNNNNIRIDGNRLTVYAATVLDVAKNNNGLRDRGTRHAFSVAAGAPPPYFDPNRRVRELFFAIA